MTAPSSEKPTRNIVFIEPRSPDVHVFTRYGLPRLGIVQLGTILEAAGYSVKIFVEDICEVDFDALFKADAVGISSITSTAPRAYALASLLKKEGMPVVMGGPHVSFLPDEALEYCDYVIKGEAEESIRPFFGALLEGGEMDGIPGLSYSQGGITVHNPTGAFCRDLDALPSPDLSLIEGWNRKSWIVPMMTSRGCPFNCEFCSVTEMFGRKYRFRSNKNVLRELRQYADKFIFFYDDNFTANRKRTRELLETMIAEKITPKWSAQVRVETGLEPGFPELMRRSNCHVVYIGLESVNPETLELYNKGQSLEEMEQAVRRFHECSIKIHGMFVLGSDHDTVDSIRKTVGWAKRFDLESVQFLILTPVPGTKVYNELSRKKRIVTEDWSLYDGHHVVFNPAKISPFELQMEMFKALSRFYSYIQAIKKFFRFQFLNSYIRLYGRLVLRGWRKRNWYFLTISKQKAYSAGSWLDTRLKKTSDDLRERYATWRTEGSKSPAPEEDRPKALPKSESAE